jgi:flagellar biogenesis protein FliO
MNRMFTALMLTLTLSTGAAMAGVKVTSLDLETKGTHEYLNVKLEGRSNSIPEIKVNGKTIEVTIGQADSFKTIVKKSSHAVLSAAAANGSAVIKAILPYEVSADAVNLGWKNKNIEIIFPKGKVTPVAAEKVTQIKTAPVPVVAQKNIIKETPALSKDSLNEEYLNQLMKENSPAAVKKDEINFKQAALEKNKDIKTITETHANSNSFSLAGYAAKFTVFLALVLGLFYGVVQLLKKGVFKRGKLGFLNNSQMIEVLSTTYVSPKRSLMIVKAHKQIFLVANSENGLEFLSEMRDTSGLLKEGEKIVTGTNFDSNLETVETSEDQPEIKLKEDIHQSTPFKEEKPLSKMAVAKDIVKFSDELKKKAKKLKPIEFN